VSKEKILLIEPIAKTFSGGSLTPIKEKRILYCRHLV